MTGNREGKCTAYSKELRMLIAVRRAVPWSRQAKNREKSRERCYLPVCSRLTPKAYGRGTGPKDLMVMRMGCPGMLGTLFFYTIGVHSISYNKGSSFIKQACLMHLW